MIMPENHESAAEFSTLITVQPTIPQNPPVVSRRASSELSPDSLPPLSPLSPLNRASDGTESIASSASSRPNFKLPYHWQPMIMACINVDSEEGQ